MNKSINIKEMRKDLRPAVATQVSDRKSAWDFLSYDINFGRSKLNDKIKYEFYMQLKSMLQARVDITTALELICEEQRKKSTKAIISGILNDIFKGSSLSEAMRSSGQFTTYEYRGIGIGEETGKLTQVLEQISDYFKAKIKQRRQVIGALTYPIVVLTVAFFAVMFMITYIVPLFTGIFSRFGGRLPGITRAVIDLSDFLQTYFLFIVLLFGAMIFTGWMLRNSDWYRHYSSMIILKMPVVGKLVQKVYLVRFSNTMSMLIGSRLPMLQSIKLLKEMIGFYPLEKALAATEEDVLLGHALSKSLAQHKVYPKKMIAMVKVAEETNQLDIFFKKIADQYSEEVEHQTAVLGKFIEPLIIVVLGAVVGFILIAMYLPLFQLGQNF